MDKQIFKAYDVRGLYPTQLDEDAAYRIGCGLARSGILSEGEDVVVGRDMRASSVFLFEALATGLNTAGLRVIDIGLCTTPMLYFAVNLFHTAGGVMITASHNPAGYNGFKFVREQAIPISSESGLQEIEQHAFSVESGPRKLMAVKQQDVSKDYIKFFAKRFSIQLPSPVIIDAGNGMAGMILPRILEEQEIRHRDLFFELDGQFPNHEANPLKEENLRHLRAAMSENPGSISIAFDGDGDRVCFLDETGSVVSGDLLTTLIGVTLLKERGTGTILYDLRSSRVVPETICACGGEPLKTRVGHAFIKSLMREKKALFGGELSYHFYFSDFFYCESGILAMLQVLKLLAESGKLLSELVEPLRKYVHSGEINFRVDHPYQTMHMVETRFTDGQVSHLDGLSIDYNDWWFNLRPSNTESLLRLNLEANTQNLMKEKIALVTKLLKLSQKGVQ